MAAIRPWATMVVTDVSRSLIAVSSATYCGPIRTRISLAGARTIAEFLSLLDPTSFRDSYRNMTWI